MTIPACCCRVEFRQRCADDRNYICRFISTIERRDICDVKMFDFLCDGASYLSRIARWDGYDEFIR